MKILALNGSVRKYGNTEILLKQALMGAEAEGAEVDCAQLARYLEGFDCGHAYVELVHAMPGAYN